MFKKIFIFFALRLLKSQLLDKIEYAPVKGYVQATYDRMTKVAEVVTDADPQDQEQLKALWEQEKHQFVVDTLDSAIEIVQAEVHDETASAIIIDLLREIQATQRATPALAA